MNLALFDFDGTLSTRDSLMPFLRHVVGTPRFVAGLIRASPGLLAYALGRTANDVAKERLISGFLGGHDLAELRRRGETFATRQLPSLLRPSMLATLQRHRRAGDVCLMVSASLDLYLAPWAASQGFDGVLCSQLAVDSDGRITGRLEPRNCHGAEKARRIEQWLVGRPPPTHITAYGDSRGDWEMLQMADSPHWIGKAPRPPAATATGSAAAGRAAR